MVARLSSEADKKFFFLWMVVCWFEVILCQSLDDSGPWQPWTRCSVSCGEGEQTRKRECLYPPIHQIERGMQTKHSQFIDCHGNRSVVTRRPCKLEPCTYFHTESDTWSPQSYSSYSTSDQARGLHHRLDKENAAMSNAYDSSKDDVICSEIDQSLVCRNDSDEHARFRRAIRLSLGEMMYSKWTPWTTCSCTTSKKIRYRFCIVGKRQCIRAKGRFHTQEASPCECGDTRESKKEKRKRLLSRKYPSQKSEPYTSWTRWGRCPCERDAFRSRNRMCRPGHEIACFEEKQLTGIGIVQLKRCRPPRRCQGLNGPMGDILAQRKRLPEQPPAPLKPLLVRQPRPPLPPARPPARPPLPPARLPPLPNIGRPVISRQTLQPPPPRFLPQEVPEIPSGSVAEETPNRVVSPSEEQPPDIPDISESSESVDSSMYVPEERRQDVRTTTTTTSAPPRRPIPVEPRLRWSPWSEWEACSKTCGTGNTYRWRECLDEQDQLTVGCEVGEYTEIRQCNPQPCPVERPVINRQSARVPVPPAPVAEIIPRTSRLETRTEEPMCRAFTSDTTRAGPRRREPITTTSDERGNDECPAYYGFTIIKPP